MCPPWIGLFFCYLQTLTEITKLFSSLVFNSHTRTLYDFSHSPQKQPSIIEKNSPAKTTIIRYHNREAVVISALQVEKNPLATPGPYTPPVQRSFHSTAMALAAFTPPSSSMLSRKSVHHLHGDHLTIASSCHGSPMRPQSTASYYTTATTALFESPRYGESLLLRNSPKPHSSPKMKLRLIKAKKSLHLMMKMEFFHLTFDFESLSFFGRQNWSFHFLWVLFCFLFDVLDCRFLLRLSFAALLLFTDDVNILENIRRNNEDSYHFTLACWRCLNAPISHHVNAPISFAFSQILEVHVSQGRWHHHLGRSRQHRKQHPKGDRKAHRDGLWKEGDDTSAASRIYIT